MKTQMTGKIFQKLNFTNTFIDLIFCDLKMLLSYNLTKFYNNKNCLWKTSGTQNMLEYFQVTDFLRKSMKTYINL